jgi:K+-transporting ATPase ATPase B chain
VVAIGKQLLITRGAITTFSVAQRVAKYFAIIPAAFLATIRIEHQCDAARDSGERQSLGRDLQRPDHHRPGTAGASWRGLPTCASGELLGRNLLIYGVGGIILPFIGIKIIDIIVTALRLA